MTGSARGGGVPRKRSQATALVDLALKAGVALFHTPEHDAYAVLEREGHRETWPLRSRGLRLWLAGRYYAATRGTANQQAMTDALGVLECQARFDGPTEPVFTRVAEHDGTLYLDLADDVWRAVAITADGWTVQTDAPVRFRRSQGMLPLPAPEAGGQLETLRELINVDDDSYIRTAAWLIGTLRPGRPFPILGIHGEPNSGKSTQGEMLRALVDPNVAPLRSPPREEVDLILQAVNGWIVGYDNLSSLPEWLTDALCRLSTGAGLGRRALYTNDEETLFAVKRPILYTAIGEVAVRGDLSDRVIATMLPRPAACRTVDALWAAFRQAHPRLLGALLDAACRAVRELPTTTLREPPRMADFATWVTAAEPALGWALGTFLRAYGRSRLAAQHATLEASAVGQAVLTFMDGRSAWAGNAKALLAELDRSVDDATRRDRAWPQGEGGPRKLSGKLRTIAPDLRAAGLEVEYEEGGGETKRRWTLRWGPESDRAGTVHRTGENGGNSTACAGRDGRDGILPLSPALDHTERQRLRAEIAAGDPLALPLRHLVEDKGT